MRYTTLICMLLLISIKAIAKDGNGNRGIHPELSLDIGCGFTSGDITKNLAIVQFGTDMPVGNLSSSILFNFGARMMVFAPPDNVQAGLTPIIGLRFATAAAKQTVFRVFINAGPMIYFNSQQEYGPGANIIGEASADILIRRRIAIGIKYQHALSQYYYGSNNRRYFTAPVNYEMQVAFAEVKLLLGHGNKVRKHRERPQRPFHPKAPIE